MPSRVDRIISGGQTGVDRAALDFAIENGIATGGFIPNGRIAEDGRVPDKYPGLKETASSDPSERTGLNILHSDATLIISRGAPIGGSKLTEQFALEHQKPVLHVDLSDSRINDPVAAARAWLERIDCRTLNIAGPRASECEHIYEDARTFLEKCFFSDR